jgi:hypothetical protein
VSTLAGLARPAPLLPGREQLASWISTRWLLAIQKDGISAQSL